MWNSQVIIMLLEGIRDTLYMTLASTLFGYIIGLPMGIVLTVTDKDGIRPNAAVYKVLDVISNLLRSIPPRKSIRAIAGRRRQKAHAHRRIPTATIVPLTIAAAPYIARMVESSLKEVDAGVIEAARSMGASDFQIVTKVMLVEARTSLIVGATISLGTILGYSAMAGTVGGGGLGDIAIRYGYTRWQTDIMVVTVVLLVILFQIFQTIGMKIANRLDRRK